jgi:hypothetical protein
MIARRPKSDGVGGVNLLEEVGCGGPGDGLAADPEGGHRRALGLEVIGHHLLGSEEHQKRVDAEHGAPGLDVLFTGDEGHLA